ncbi:TPA: hypothetical protein U1B13_000822 [Streptococcus suis]|nr:hypothetical protein [Streptococcus suis]
MTKQEFLRKLKQARKKTLEVQDIKAEILDGFDLEDVPFSADNSKNLDEAIQCFIDYGELPISQNLDDFWIAYQSSV